MRGHARWILLALALTGCPEDEADPCDETLAPLDARLREAIRWSEPPGAPPDVPLVFRADAVAVERDLPLLVVARDGVRWSGRGVGGLETLNRTAEALHTELTSRTDPEAPIGLWVDPEVRAEELVGLLREAPLESPFVMLVRTGERRDGGPSPIGGRPAARREQLEEAWADAIEGCDAARSRLPMPGALVADGLPLAPPSTTRLIDALASCDCEALDLDAIEEVAIDAITPEQGAVGRAPVEIYFGPSPMSESVGVAPDATAQQLVDALPSRGAVIVRVE